MGGVHWTKPEIAAAKKAVAEYKKDYPERVDWYKDYKRPAYHKPILEVIHESRPNKEKSAADLFQLVLGHRKSRLSPAVMAAVGKKGRTARQIETSRALGKARWEGMRSRMKAFGLTDKEVEVIISGKGPKLSTEQVSDIESKLLTHKTLVVSFTVAEDGLSVRYSVAQDALKPQESTL